MIQFKLYCYFSVDLIINGCSLIQLLRVFSGLFMPSVVMLERAHLVARVSSHSKAGVILVSPTEIQSMITFANCCLEAMMMNSVYYSSYRVCPSSSSLL